MELEKVIRTIKERVGKEILWGGTVTFLLGFFIHMFVFVNHYPTYSGLNLFINDGRWHAIEGRWFSSILERCTSVVTIPTFIGVLSLFFWSVSFAVIIKIWRIKSKLVIFLSAGLFISFPVIAGFYTFLYTAHCYALGVMLACWGTLFLIRNKNTLCVICLVLSLATYQTTISVTMVLIFIITAFGILEGEEIYRILVRGVRYFFVIATSFIIYYLSFKLYLFVEKVSSYRDIKLSISLFLRGIIKCYGGGYWFLIWGTLFSLPTGRVIITTLIILLFCETGLVVYRRINQWSNRIIRIFLLILLVILFPIVANYAFIISPDEARTYRQFISYVIVFLLPIIMYERYRSDIICILRTKRCYLAIIEVVLIVYSIVTVFFFSITDNIAYMNMHIIYEKEYSLAVRIVDRIENTKGYESGMPVIIIFRKDYSHLYGGTLESKLDKYMPGMEQCGWGMLSDPTGIKNFVSEFMQTDMNIVWEEVDFSKLNGIKKWPHTDCTMIKDGKLYIYIS